MNRSGSAPQSRECTLRCIRGYMVRQSILSVSISIRADTKIPDFETILQDLGCTTATANLSTCTSRQLPKRGGEVCLQVSPSKQNEAASSRTPYRREQGKRAGSGRNGSWSTRIRGAHAGVSKQALSQMRKMGFVFGEVVASCSWCIAHAGHCLLLIMWSGSRAGARERRGLGGTH